MTETQKDVWQRKAVDLREPRQPSKASADATDRISAPAIRKPQARSVITRTLQTADATPTELS